MTDVVFVNNLKTQDSDMIEINRADFNLGDVLLVEMIDDKKILLLGSGAGRTPSVKGTGDGKVGSWIVLGGTNLNAWDPPLGDCYTQDVIKVVNYQVVRRLNVSVR